MNYSLANKLTDVAADDYSIVPMAVTFLAGSTAGDQLCTDVTATADGFVEDVEDLILSLTTTEGSVDFAENRDTTTISIIDINSEFVVSHGIDLVCRPIDRPFKWGSQWGQVER